jgi:hypothetical protein
MDLAPFFMIALVLFFMVFYFRWHFTRSAAILEKWADENGYEILERSYRWFFRGPFFFRTSKGQTVYRVTVRDKAGNVQTGWVACGSWWWGLLSDQARVIWDELPKETPTTSVMCDRWLDD